MRSLTLCRLAGLAALLSPAAAWAQASPITPPPTASTTGAGTGALTMFGLILGLLVLVGIGVKLYDLKRRREADAVHLQAQISDALLREQALFGMPITPTAHVPFLGGSPAVIEVTGHVPSPEARETALTLIREEAARIRPDFTIEDKLEIEPALARHAA
jgi:hypothetical protein